MPATTPVKKKTFKADKLYLDSELRLIREVKKRMKANGEIPSAESLRRQGLSEGFIKRFLSA
jgi:hypothetical protein